MQTLFIPKLPFQACRQRNCYVYAHQCHLFGCCDAYFLTLLLREPEQRELADCVDKLPLIFKNWQLMNKFALSARVVISSYKCSSMVDVGQFCSQFSKGLSLMGICQIPNTCIRQRRGPVKNLKNTH